MNHPHPVSRLVVALVATLALVTAACGDDAEPETSSPTNEEQNVEGSVEDEPDPEPAGSGGLCAEGSVGTPVEVDTTDPQAYAGTELTMVAYDSFAVSDGVFEQFEEQTGITVSIVTAADTGTMVSQAVLTAGNPVADVMWGLDNTFLCRALDNDLFVPYESPMLASIDDALELDAAHRVTPVDVSDQCVNYLPAQLETVPESLSDLTDPAFAGTFVTQNPETSAPGMGLLLTTIAVFGEDGWETFWENLVANDVAVTAGWSEAYYEEFAAYGGDRPIVMSYATSPVAELLFAEEPLDSPPTANIADSCFRSIEFTGILAGTDHPEAAALLVDFLASPTFQEDIPLNLFVFPANSEAAVPPEFDQFARLADDPVTLDPASIEANRDAWTQRWTEIVLR